MLRGERSLRAPGEPLFVALLYASTAQPLCEALMQRRTERISPDRLHRRQEVAAVCHEAEAGAREHDADRHQRCGGVAACVDKIWGEQDGVEGSDPAGVASGGRLNPEFDLLYDSVRVEV